MPFFNKGPVLNGFAENKYDSVSFDELKFKEDNKCMMCRIIANYVIALLNENVTANEVKKGLDKVCDYLPGELRAYSF